MDTIDRGTYLSGRCENLIFLKQTFEAHFFAAHCQNTHLSFQNAFIKFVMKKTVLTILTT